MGSKNVQIIANVCIVTSQIPQNHSDLSRTLQTKGRPKHDINAKTQSKILPNTKRADAM